MNDALESIVILVVIGFLIVAYVGIPTLVVLGILKLFGVI